MPQAEIYDRSIPRSKCNRCGESWETKSLVRHVCINPVERRLQDLETRVAALEKPDESSEPSLVD
jgi:hypothetical protein